MPAHQVYDLLGKPDEIKKNTDSADAGSETWVYLQTTRRTGVTQMAMEDSVAYDSLTDQVRTIQVPVTKPITHRTVDRLEILMEMDGVVGWRQSRTSDQDLSSN